MKRNTGNNFHNIRLPPVKLGVARRGFYFTCGSLYNNLPLDIREIVNTKQFKKAVSRYLN